MKIMRSNVQFLYEQVFNSLHPCYLFDWPRDDDRDKLLEKKKKTKGLVHDEICQCWINFETGWTCRRYLPLRQLGQSRPHRLYTSFIGKYKVFSSWKYVALIVLTGMELEHSTTSANKEFQAQNPSLISVIYGDSGERYDEQIEILKNVYYHFNCSLNRICQNMTGKWWNSTDERPVISTELSQLYGRLMSIWLNPFLSRILITFWTGGYLFHSFFKPHSNTGKS